MVAFACGGTKPSRANNSLSRGNHLLRLAQSSILLLLLCLLSTPATAQEHSFPDTAVYSLTQIQSDFDFLHQALREGHPAWGLYYPVDSMEKWFAQTRANLQGPLTERDFRQILYPLIHRLGCGHTRLLWSKKSTKFQKEKDGAQTPRYYPPFRATYLNQKLYLTASTDSTLLPPGSELLKINRRPVKSVLQDLFQRFTSDGYNESNAHALIQRNFDGYFRFHFGEWPKFDLQIVLPQGDTVQRLVPALKTTLDQRLAASKQRRAELLIPGPEIIQKKGYRLGWLGQDSTVAVMDIRGFRLWRGLSFYRKAFRHLEKEGIEHLVIDLRNNGGGAIKDAFRLSSYLLEEPAEIVAERRRGKADFHKQLNQKFLRKVVATLVLPFTFKKRRLGDRVQITGIARPRTKHHYSGKVYLLTNGRTFSASVMVGAFLRDQQRAVFIGQETGGGEKGTNAFLLPKLTLPESGLRLVFPMYRITHQVGALDYGRGIFPDHEVYYDLEAQLEGRDLEVEELRRVLRGGD